MYMPDVLWCVHILEKEPHAAGQGHWFLSFLWKETKFHRIHYAVGMLEGKLFCDPEA